MRHELVLATSGERGHLGRFRVGLVGKEHVQVPVFDRPEAYPACRVTDFCHIQSLPFPPIPCEMPVASDAAGKLSHRRRRPIGFSHAAETRPGPAPVCILVDITSVGWADAVAQMPVGQFIGQVEARTFAFALT